MGLFNRRKERRNRETTLDWLKGLKAQSVKDLVGGDYWEFHLGEATFFNIACPWRLVVEGRIELAGRDHRQKFGLPEPVDAELAATALLLGRRVTSADLVEGTGDVSLTFDGKIRLDVFNNSSGYEGWQLKGDDGRLIIAMGGGEIAEFPPNA